MMHEIDGSGGKRQPSSREEHMAYFPSVHLQSFICVCAEMLWSGTGEIVGVGTRAIVVVDYFSRGLSFSKDQSINSGFTIRVVDPILPV